MVICAAVSTMAFGTSMPLTFMGIDKLTICGTLSPECSLMSMWPSVTSGVVTLATAFNAGPIANSSGVAMTGPVAGAITNWSHVKVTF